MNKSILWTIAALIMVACGNKTGQASDADSTAMDSTVTDSVVVAAADEKHSPDYVRQRIDSIYSPYKNPKYDKVGMRLMKPRGDFDAMYCSMRYKNLLQKAEAMAVAKMISCWTTITGLILRTTTTLPVKWVKSAA